MKSWHDRLYTRKLPVTAAHVLDQDVLPRFETRGTRIETILVRRLVGHPASTSCHAPAANAFRPALGGGPLGGAACSVQALSDVALRGLPC